MYQAWWLKPINPSYLGGKDQANQVPRQPGQKVLETPISTNKKPGVVVHTCHPNYTGRISKKSVVQAGLSLKGDPISKITNAKQSQGVEHLSHKSRT
jgi:heterodisulfide reductase subunit A-like polyferredoxin